MYKKKTVIPGIHRLNHVRIFYGVAAKAASPVTRPAPGASDPQQFGIEHDVDTDHLVAACCRNRHKTEHGCQQDERGKNDSVRMDILFYEKRGYLLNL